MEASNQGIIDSGCTSTVAGTEWTKTKLLALIGKERDKVVLLKAIKYLNLEPEVFRSL